MTTTTNIAKPVSDKHVVVHV